MSTAVWSWRAAAVALPIVLGTLGSLASCATAIDVGYQENDAAVTPPSQIFGASAESGWR